VISSSVEHHQDLGFASGESPPRVGKKQAAIAPYARLVFHTHEEAGHIWMFFAIFVNNHAQGVRTDLLVSKLNHCCWTTLDAFELLSTRQR
jgi:hypothetical protein